MKLRIVAPVLVWVLAGASLAGARVNQSSAVAAMQAPLPPPALAGSYPPLPPAATPPPELVVDQVPRFIYLPALGFYVSVDIPYDIAYLEGGYYLYSGGYWYYCASYRGPWSIVPLRRLPAGLKHYRYQQIRDLRNREYQEFLRDRAHYRGSWHRPVPPRQEQHREERRHQGW